MIKNRVLNKKMQSKSKDSKINGLFLTDRILEMNEYQNMIKNKKKIINKRISEEEKNIENSLLKLNNKFNEITVSKLRNENQDFIECYNKYSKTNLNKKSGLFQDLSQNYYSKENQIPNVYNNLFKINPLLDNNINKIYLSNLSLLNGKKVSKRKLLNSNKAIKYMKKLKNIISPEKDNEEEKRKNMPPNLIKQKLITKHIKIKEKNKKQQKILTHSIKNLLKMINNNNLNSLEEQSNPRTRNKSEIINKKEKEIYYDKLYNTNIIDIKSQIKNEKQWSNYKYNKLTTFYDSDSSINKRSINQNTTINIINNFYLDINKNNEYDLSYRKKNKTFYSKKIKIPKLNGLFSIESNTINLNNNKENELYIKTERKEAEGNKYILNTPKIIKNQSSSHEKSNNNTKAFSLSIENSSLSNRTKFENSKTKESSIQKIKEFTINSYKSKYINKFNQSNGIKSCYSSSNKLKTDLISKTDKKIPLEFKITSPKRLFNIDEDKEKYIHNIYKSLNFGNLGNVEKDIKLYLSKIKKLNENEIKEIIDKYKSKNIKLNIQEMNKLIEEKDISNKIFRLYLNNNDYNRIEPLIKAINEKDKKIMKFDKIIVKTFINN